MTVTPQLGPKQVHVYVRALAAEPEDEAHAVLSADEMLRATRLRISAARRRFVSSRSILRRTLASYIDLPPAGISFFYTASGKPLFPPTDGLRRLEFNLSHSGDLVVIAVSEDREVGVDLEGVAADIPFNDLAARFFSPSENESLAAVPEARRLEAFYRIWTGKEAYLKGRGSGITVPFAEFSVVLSPALAICPDPSLDDDREWRLSELSVPPGYLATLATPGEAEVIYR